MSIWEILTPKNIVLLLSLFIYVLILISFNKARKKYSGGKVGEVIKIILVTVVFLFISEYAYAFQDILPSEVTFILGTVFKTIGLGFLAYGGAKIASKK